MARRKPTHWIYGKSIPNRWRIIRSRISNPKTIQSQNTALQRHKSEQIERNRLLLLRLRHAKRRKNKFRRFMDPAFRQLNIFNVPAKYIRLVFIQNPRRNRYISIFRLVYVLLQRWLCLQAKYRQTVQL